MPAEARKTYHGEGRTLEDALKEAHNKIEGSPNTADELIISRVTAFGLRTGGIFGEATFYVDLEQDGGFHG